MRKEFIRLKLTGHSALLREVEAAEREKRPEPLNSLRAAETTEEHCLVPACPLARSLALSVLPAFFYSPRPTPTGNVDTYSRLKATTSDYKQSNPAVTCPLTVLISAQPGARSQMALASVEYQRHQAQAQAPAPAPFLKSEIMYNRGICGLKDI